MVRCSNTRYHRWGRRDDLRGPHLDRGSGHERAPESCEDSGWNYWKRGRWNDSEFRHSSDDQLPDTNLNGWQHYHHRYPVGIYDDHPGRNDGTYQWYILDPYKHGR